MNIEDLKKQLFTPSKAEVLRGGKSNKGTIEKNGRFYHVVQRGRNRENIYDDRSARYRHDLLCSQCLKNGVGVLFSVVMPNHTHDLLYSESWDNISKTLKSTNTQVARFIKKSNPKKFKIDKRVFDERPVYIAIKNIRHLGIAGKYIYENFAEYERQNKFVPFSCFFGMRNDYLPVPPYRKDLYEFIYGLDIQNLCSFFEKASTKDIEKLMENRFSSFSKTNFDALFKINPSLPWLFSD